ncbi:hypothetical protein [Methylobacterium nonmethylotrophicum]|uniref:Uncharacterized protein n=1 Tax=Methylobacterium nonmethylotrophicum TaxID=1141884 RepID=A0A4Z0NYU0_9HYPH|nr:hypothetical protein [Methylobacterium nonmethylotrophicum]TGE02644.1 hypothetical protein EU555_02460 [Methylobacterium nonmethylotrophicum]
MRTIEIVWAPATAPSRRPGPWLAGLATVAKVLVLPVLLAGSLYSKPLYDCHKQKKYGMLYYGTTVQMCVSERLSERLETVQAFVDRQLRQL